MSAKANWRVLGAAILAAVVSASALGNQIPGVLITGHVTAVSNGDWIAIDGRNYRIPAGSPIASVARALTTGQWVDVRLSGPPTSAASTVISVAPHQE